MKGPTPLHGRAQGHLSVSAGSGQAASPHPKGVPRSSPHATLTGVSRSPLPQLKTPLGWKRPTQRVTRTLEPMLLISAPLSSKPGALSCVHTATGLLPSLKSRRFQDVFF